MSEVSRPLPFWLAYVRQCVRMLRVTRARLRIGRKLQFGHGFELGPNATLLPPNYAHFGNDVAIAAQFHLEANLSTGNDVVISSRVAIIGNDHDFTSGGSRYQSPRNPPAIATIGSRVFIGFGTTIIGSVHIGDGCIIGARSVVTRDLPANTLCVGSPARPIRSVR